MNLYDVAELPGGRLLLTDSRENAMIIADTKTGPERRIGRFGDAPGEYPPPIPQTPPSTRIMISLAPS
jgi:hypothetical protein